MHPVALLYMDKLADLQRRPDNMVLCDAYVQAKAVVDDALQIEIDQEIAERRLPNC